MIVGVVIIYSFLHRILSNFPRAELGGAVCADVTSANVVGYQNQNLAKGKGMFTMVSVPFVHVSDTKGFDLENDLTLEGKHGDADWTPSKSDQIWVWDPAKGASGAYNKFYWDVGFDDPSEGWDPGWTEVVGQELMFADMYPNGLPEGGAFYFQNSEANAKALTVSGAVESKDEAEIDLAAGKGMFTMVGNPYPVATDLEKLTLEGKHGDADWTPSKSDQIWVWDPAKGASGAYNKFYWDVGFDDPSEGWDPGWTEVVGQKLMFADIYPNGIPSGTPFYFQNSETGAKSVTFVSPLIKE